MRAHPRLTNLCRFNRVGIGGDILIAGFTISGASTKNLSSPSAPAS